jgi:hypothetical protein
MFDPHRLHAVLSLTLLSLLAGACGLPHGSDEVSAEVSLPDLGQRLAVYVERIVLTRGWVVAVGEVPQGVWVSAAVSQEAMDRARASPDTLAAADGLTLLFPPGTPRAFLDEMQGRQIELLVRVVDEVGLPDGRRAVRVLPLQVGAVQRFDVPLGVPP